MIDLLVGVYGFVDTVEAQVVAFLRSLREKCDLTEVNVFCIERACQPVSELLRGTITSMGFQVRSCPLPIFRTSREDTSQFCDWMVLNCGDSSWFTVSHYDVTFYGDYFAYIRSLADTADMVGNHHDGIVSMSREAYRKCQLGFCGVDRLYAARPGNMVKVIPAGSPEAVGGEDILSLDVGDLLTLRVETLRLRHVWLRDEHLGLGKSALFEHSRGGSGHSTGVDPRTLLD